MKITKRDLDPDIVAKIEQFDKIQEQYDNENPDGYISYGPNGFFFKHTNDTFLKKIFTEDEIVDLENSLYTTRKNILSSNLVDIRIDKTKYNAAIRSMMFNAKDHLTKITYDSRVYKVVEYDNAPVVLTINGTLYINDCVLPIITTINESFNLYLSASNISDIRIVDDTTYLIATFNHGIFKYTADNKVELICVPQDVQCIEITHTGNLFVGTNTACIWYDISNGQKTEKSSVIFNSQQIPTKVIKTTDMLIIIAASTGYQATSSLIHIWKLDAAKVGYNYMRVPVSFERDNSYAVLHSQVYQGDLYLFGRHFDKVFVAKYSLNEIVQCDSWYDLNISATSFIGAITIEDFIVTLCADVLYIIKDNKIVENMMLDRNSFGLELIGGQICQVSHNNINIVNLPKFESTAETLKFDIYNGSEPCNNIDIFIKNAGRSERVMLVDGETGKVIDPSYYIVYNGDSVLKLMNCKSTKIHLYLSVTATSSIGGIVVKYNRMFLR